jgi:hypothetical protein
MRIHRTASSVLLGLLVLAYVGAAQAITITNQSFTWVDPSSSGVVDIAVTVTDNGLTMDWVYNVTNISYDPAPGASNGLSGFHLVFADAVPELSNVFGPAGWINNCCGVPPPDGWVWDITNNLGFGIAVGASDLFGFTTGQRGLVVQSGSWMHSWVVPPFCREFPRCAEYSAFGQDILVPGQPIPEPSSVTAFSVGLLLVHSAVRRRTRARPAK